MQEEARNPRLQHPLKRLRTFSLLVLRVSKIIVLMVSRSTQAGSGTSNFQATPEQIAQLSALLTQATHGAQGAEQPPGSNIFLSP